MTSGDDIGGILGPVQQGAGALVELLAVRTAAEPAIALGGALGSLCHGFRSAFQAPHLRPPLCEKQPYTQPSPRRPGVVARALTEPRCPESRADAGRGYHSYSAPIPTEAAPFDPISPC